VLAVGGAYSSPPGSGPFPVSGLIGWFKPLYDYSWVVGLLVAFLLYYVLTVIFPVRRQAAERAAAAAT
jgi:NCS1 family nucleobase:cation symporter-1